MRLGPRPHRCERRRHVLVVVVQEHEMRCLRSCDQVVPRPRPEIHVVIAEDEHLVARLKL
jgi:hypothetical protein